MKLSLTFICVVLCATYFQGSVWGLDSESVECNDECCYWYQVVPANVTCRPGPNHQIPLLCQIITRRDPTTDVTVRWYHSQDQESARENGTILNNSDKYILSNVLVSTPLTNGSIPLYLDAYSLIINDLNNSDSGYYWCQIFVNGTGLIPSLYGEITTLTNVSQCSSLNTQSRFASNPMCAGSLTTPVDSSTSETTPNDSLNGQNSSLPTSTEGTISTSPSVVDSSCPLPISNSSSCIGVLVIIVLIIAASIIGLVVVLSVIIGHFYCKRNKKFLNGSKQSQSGSRTIEKISSAEMENFEYAHFDPEVTQNIMSPDDELESTNDHYNCSGGETYIVTVTECKLDHTYDTINASHPATTVNDKSHTYDTLSPSIVQQPEYASVKPKLAGKVKDPFPDKSVDQNKSLPNHENNYAEINHLDKGTNLQKAKLNHTIKPHTVVEDTTATDKEHFTHFTFDDRKGHMYHVLENTNGNDRVGGKVINEYSTPHQHQLEIQDTQHVSGGGDTKGVVSVKTTQEHTASPGSLPTIKEDVGYDRLIQVPMSKQEASSHPGSLSGTTGDFVGGEIGVMRISGEGKERSIVLGFDDPT